MVMMMSVMTAVMKMMIMMTKDMCSTYVVVLAHGNAACPLHLGTAALTEHQLVQLLAPLLELRRLAPRDIHPFRSVEATHILLVAYEFHRSSVRRNYDTYFSERPSKLYSGQRGSRFVLSLAGGILLVAAAPFGSTSPSPRPPFPTERSAK